MNQVVWVKYNAVPKMHGLAPAKK